MAHFDILRQVKTDVGSSFKPTSFRGFCRCYLIEHIKCPTLDHRWNRKIETSNRKLKEWVDIFKKRFQVNTGNFSLDFEDVRKSRVPKS